MSTTDQIDFDSLGAQLTALIANERDKLASSALFVALLYNALPDINWLGLYVLRDDELVLGPFQGNPACVHIPLGQGVCGSAAAKRETLCVADVEDFSGHVVCDVASKSEIVVPLCCDGQVVGVLDIDSPLKSRFGPKDQHGIESLCRIFEKLVIEKATASMTDGIVFI